MSMSVTPKKERGPQPAPNTAQMASSSCVYLGAFVLVIGPILMMILVPQAPEAPNTQAFYPIFTAFFFATICCILEGSAVASMG
jgi:hypothetical protein